MPKRTGHGFLGRDGEETVRGRLPQKRAGLTDDKPGKSHARGFEMQNRCLEMRPRLGDGSHSASQGRGLLCSVNTEYFVQTGPPPDHMLVCHSWCRSSGQIRVNYRAALVVNNIGVPYQNQYYFVAKPSKIKVIFASRVYKNQ
jgi:hypothetical protein